LSFQLHAVWNVCCHFIPSAKVQKIGPALEFIVHLFLYMHVHDME